MKAETSVGLHMKGWESALWWLWLQFIWISSGGEKKKMQDEAQEQEYTVKGKGNEELEQLKPV